MLIATWNVNSIKVREERLLAWLAAAEPDVVCLQELKVVDEAFPLAAVEAAGYHAAIHGMRAYNGVAILSRTPITDVRIGLDDGVDDPQARLIAGTVQGVRVLSAYFPNGETVGSDKWVYKLAWMARLERYLAAHHAPDEPLALCGDFNVAPDDGDVGNPARWAESVLCHREARAALARIGDRGLVDLFRRRHPAGGVWSWWDYQGQGFDKDDGLRIDHIWTTAPLAGRLVAAAVDRYERSGKGASDHAPLCVALDAATRYLPIDAAYITSRATPLTDADRQMTPDVPASPPPPSPTPPSRPRKLIIIDGHSLAYRAFYGLPHVDRHGKPSFSTAGGTYTNAVYGFANMLIKTWIDERPDYLAVAFDLGRTFRDDLFAAYKGTRMKMPDELVPQIDLIRELVEAFDIPALTAEGYEADDILGTIAHRAAADGIDVLIVTGDSDSFQLIRPHVRVMSPGRLWSDIAIWDEAAVAARYDGLTPAQLIDFKALKGDSSDNIPGVRGIGEKGAGQLLKAYGTVEGIYAHLDEVTPPRAQNALDAGRDMAFLSKDLVTIRTDVPLDVTWEKCAVHSYDVGPVLDLFDRLEFRSIRHRLPPGGIGAGAAGDGAAAGTSSGPPAGTGTPGAAARRSSRAVSSQPAQLAMFPEAEADGPPVPPPADITATAIVRDRAGLDALVAALSTAPIIAFDTETTATDPLDAALVGLSFAVTEGAGWYVPVGHAEGEQLAMADVLAALRPVLEDPARPKVGHNAKYDVVVLAQHGIDVRGVTYDTMLAEFLIDPGGRMGLKTLAGSKLGVRMTEISELLGTGKHQITMDHVDISHAAPYAAADADVTLRLLNKQSDELDALGLRALLTEVDVPLVPVLVDMERAGVLIDVARLGAMSERLGARLHEIEDEVRAAVGVDFNLSSPQQLGEILFNTLGLTAPGARKTATGRTSVAADVLESLRGAHPVVDLALEHRQLSKLKGTYLDALPKLVKPATGRVHTSFNQTGAVSGRLASTDPNLQNIPIRTDLGKEVRQAFIVPPGWKLIAADYSQVELRITAHITKDAGLVDAFRGGEDIHRATAATVLGIAPEAVTSDQRSFAKRVNFGLLYGMGARSLAEQAGIPLAEAKQFVDAYFTRFPGIAHYIATTKQLAKDQGYVTTLLGRRRAFPILRSTTADGRTRMLQASAEREAINHPIQGTAADIIKIAMIHIHAKLAAEKLNARLLLQVHDELVLEAPEAEVPRVIDLVRTTMETAYPLDPPLVVEVGVGDNWDDVK
ncbi:MAG: DNA polymerase I [Ardenticatenales bacterium]|nr:DNA polymerase I [Ardenticatenales bacterium]